MHTEALPRQFKLVVPKEEAKIISEALGLVANNPGWDHDTRQIATSLSKQIDAILTQVV